MDPSTAGFHVVAGSPRTVHHFGPGWRFVKADAVGAERPEFDDSGWEAANLPHGLEILSENASGCRNYQGPAWYRKRFQTPAAAADGRLYLFFEAVMGHAVVWVNGIRVAEHFGGYLPFAADLTDHLRPAGGDNYVAVRADNSDDPTYPPGKPQHDLDFSYLGGIYRDVLLIGCGPVHITLTELSATVAGGGVFVGVLATEGDSAEIEVRTELINTSGEARQVVLRSVLETREGRELLCAEQAVSLAAGDSAAVIQPMSPRGVTLWHPGAPVLHTIRTEVLEGGRVLDSLRTRFGLRMFEMRGPQGLFINGRPIGHKLNGVNRHQDYALVGNALPNSGQWRDAQLLREGGSRIVRAAHYPLDPAFYDACDELGLLVTTANPGWQFYNGDDPRFEQRIYEDTRNLVRRDRNRPAMLLWETALNETPHQPASLLAEMHRIAHEEYPYPGLFTVADVDEATHGGLDVTYHGGFDEQRCSFTREYGDGGEVDNFYSHNAATRVKRAWGEEPLLKQARIRARDLDDCHATPPIRLGAALWCGIDHQRGYHPDPFWGGLLDAFRIRRYAYDLFRSQYDADYVLPGIATGPLVAIAHELTQVSGADVLVYSNCEQVRLTWLGEVIGTQSPDSGYPALPHPPFTFRTAFDFAVINTHWRDRTGHLEMIAEGLIGAEVVARAVRRYPERTTGVSLSVDDVGLPLVADGSDFVPVRATIVDNKGVPKVLAAEDVWFEVDGPAELIDGPLARVNPARTEFGTATALIRATTTPGAITVRAHVRGLASAEVALVSRPSPLPLLFDADYAAGSRPAGRGATVAAAVAPPAPATEADALRDEVVRLRQALTAKEQDLMELRGRRE